MKCYVLWLWTKLQTDKQSFQCTEWTKASKTYKLAQLALEADYSTGFSGFEVSVLYHLTSFFHPVGTTWLQIF